LDGHRRVVDVERARRLARRRADAAGELGEVVGGVEDVERLAEVPAINEVVPLRDDVVDGAAALAERDAAVHAARPLPADRLIGHREGELLERAHALRDRELRRLLPGDLEEPRRLTHEPEPPAARSRSRPLWRR